MWEVGRRWGRGRLEPLPTTGAGVHGPCSGARPRPASGVLSVQALPLVVGGDACSRLCDLGASSRTPQLGRGSFLALRRTCAHLCPSNPSPSVTFLKAQSCARGL